MTRFVVKGLCSGYGSMPVLYGIDFSVGNSETLGITGHNGMGKTTLLRTLAGFLRTSSGSIRLDGVDVTRLAPHDRSARGMGYVAQGDRGFTNLTVRQTLTLAALSAARGKSVPFDEIAVVFPEILRILDRPCAALSGGERQLLAIARACSQRPTMLLLDELTDGVQPSMVWSIMEKLQTLRAENGMSIVVVDQNQAFVKALAPRVLTLQKGKLLGEPAL